MAECLKCHEGTHVGENGKCSYCGSTARYPVRRMRHRVIGGKRGRNSGTTNKSKTTKK